VKGSTQAVREGRYRAGKIAYGMHVTGHMHFLDAQDGGYTAAAVQLKQQLKEETS